MTIYKTRSLQDSVRSVERNRVVVHWLDGNLSDRTMREALGLDEYMGMEYPKVQDR